MDILEINRLASLDILNAKSENPMQDLNLVLRKLAALRSFIIYNTIIENEGSKILQGPFKGMNFFSNPLDISEGCMVPKLIGTYESELHPLIEKIKQNKFDVIINIGSAEGYYSVGLKKLLGNVDVYAYDIDPKSKVKTTQLSELNNVSVVCRQEFTSSDLNLFKNNNTLIFCDIEGDEIKLFNETEISKYKNFSILVETHMTTLGHSKDLLPDLFSNTHNIELIEQGGSDSFVVPNCIAQSNHLDILISKWEFRDHPTPWLYLSPKSIVN